MKLTDLKKVLPILIIILIVVFIVIVLILKYTYYGSSKVNPKLDSPDTNIKYQQSFDAITQQNNANPDPRQYVVNLQPHMPFQGQYFSLNFNYDNNTWIVTFKKGQEPQGQAELDQYLQSVNVDKKYLTPLVTKVQ